MNRNGLALLLACACGALAVACAGAADDHASKAAEADVVDGALRAQATDRCSARFVFLQKDAYKSIAGRSSELWPPHTTTVLEVTCQTARGEQRVSPFKENHGTKPGEKDAEGNEFLVPVDVDPSVVSVSAPWSEMKKLVSSYQSCGCDESQFLGLDTIDGAGKGLLEKLAPILECPDGSDALLLALKERRFEDAKRITMQCRLKEGVTTEQLEQAVADVDAQVRQTFAEHHVCNNDALLQMDLFARFRDHGDATACNAHNRALCYGPKLFFEPKKEAR